MRSLLRFHRWMGLAGGIFFLVLAVTGVMLNHTDGLHLHERKLDWDWLLNWYGIKQPVVSNSFALGNHRATQVNFSTYFDERNLALPSGDLVGGIVMEDLFIIAQAERLILLSAQGEVHELIEAHHGLPTPLDALGTTTDGKLTLHRGPQAWLADIHELSFSPYSGISQKSLPVAIPDPIKANLVRHYRGNLSLEKIVLDLHSGRLWGSWGPWVMDAAALTLLALSGTGLYIALRLKRV